MHHYEGIPCGRVDSVIQEVTFVYVKKYGAL